MTRALGKVQHVLAVCYVTPVLVLSSKGAGVPVGPVLIINSWHILSQIRKIQEIVTHRCILHVCSHLHAHAVASAVHLVAGSTTSPFFPQIARTKTCTTPRKRLYEAFFLQKHVETCIRLHDCIFQRLLGCTRSLFESRFLWS